MENDPREGLISILATPVLIIDLVAVLLFNIGWTYIYYLYDAFGVNVHALNIPVYYFFVYALPVIHMNIGSFVLMLIVLILVLVLMRLRNRRLQNKLQWLNERDLVISIVTLFLLIVLTLSDSLAQETAREAAADMRSGNAKTIHFFFKEKSPDSYPQEFFDANNNGKLKLLAQTADRFVVFYQPESAEKILPLASTYVVFSSDIRLASIELENVLRKE